MNKEINPVENIEFLIQKYFAQKVLIKDKTITNNCIGALVAENNYDDFKRNFEERLQRLSLKFTDSEQRKEIVEKIKNLAETTGRKWSGAYSELVALDYFLNSDYIMNPKFINKFSVSEYPDCLAAKNNKQTIDIDFSFELKCKKFYTDIKSLIPTQIEVLDSIIDNVIKQTDKTILIGLDDLEPESLIDFQSVIENEKKNIEQELLKNVIQSKTQAKYITSKGFEYKFNISFNGFLSTMHTKNPYELAKFDKYKYLNYYNKLLDKEYSFLTFVINPWFNEQINDFCEFNKIYYRSVCRRVFMEFTHNFTPAAEFFKDIKNYSITLSDISKSIAGILFIEDKSITYNSKKVSSSNYKEITGDFTKKLYESYLYLNPNYANKKALSIYDFSSVFDGFELTKMVYIDDFQDDNY